MRTSYIFSFKNNIFARGGFCTFPQLNMTTILYMGVKGLGLEVIGVGC